MPPRFTAFCPLVTLLLALATLGCSEKEVTAYRVPKEPAIPPELASVVAGSSTANPTASAPGTVAAGTLAWRAPERWFTKPNSALRRGSFDIPGAYGPPADLSVIAFPGEAGGLLGNINRWRNQVGLPPYTQASLDEAVLHLDVGPLHFDIVDFAGTLDGVPTRITGAITMHAGESWFFKLMGADATVAAAREEFIALINTVAITR